MHVVPSVTVGFEQAPVLGLHVPAAWHWSEAVQVTLLPAVHNPAWQVSFKSQALPSLQLVPLVAAGFEQAPVVGSQVPAAWHWSEAVHVTGLDPTHVPLAQAKVWKQALLLGHVVPSGADGLEQAPVVGLHVPAEWHASLAAHVTGVPEQVPAWQVSFSEQRLPSLHAVPLARVVDAHWPVLGTHALGWQGFVEEQVTGFDGTQ